MSNPEENLSYSQMGWGQLDLRGKFNRIADYAMCGSIATACTGALATLGLIGVSFVTGDLQSLFNPVSVSAYGSLAALGATALSTTAYIATADEEQLAPSATYDESAQKSNEVIGLAAANMITTSLLLNYSTRLL